MDAKYNLTATQTSLPGYPSYGYWTLQLSMKRFVNVHTFNGKILVDIREYYEDDAGELKPGRKGDSLEEL